MRPIADSSSGVRFAARALPPLWPPARPPSQPSATAAAFFSSRGGDWDLGRIGSEWVADPAPLGERGDQLAGRDGAVPGRVTFGPLAGFVVFEPGAETLGFVFVPEGHTRRRNIPGCALGWWAGHRQGRSTLSSSAVWAGSVQNATRRSRPPWGSGLENSHDADPCNSLAGNLHSCGGCHGVVHSVCHHTGRDRRSAAS